MQVLTLSVVLLFTVDLLLMVLVHWMVLTTFQLQARFLPPLYTATPVRIHF